MILNTSRSVLSFRRAYCGYFASVIAATAVHERAIAAAENGMALTASSASAAVVTSALSLDPSVSFTLGAARALASSTYACACGCGMFEVGTSSMLPRGEGGQVWLEFDHQNQNRNWGGSSRAPAENNTDKNLRTEFVTAGFQYMFNRSWGVEAEVPYDLRHFEAVSSGPAGGTATANWSSIGDIRLRGIYTGLSDDMSLGLNFGLKLPTGNFKQDGGDVDIDRDTQIGSGSTDVLLGAFYRHPFAEQSSWDWFAQVNADVPVLIQHHYRPGAEFDQALGLYYTGWSVRGVNIVPICQIIASERTSDSGTNSANPTASGYTRLFLSPGIEFDFHPIMIYADVELPVYQHVTGDQLIAPASFKVVVSYSF